MNSCKNSVIINHVIIKLWKVCILKAFNIIQKISLCICLLLIEISLSACEKPEDKVLISLGEYKNNVFYSEGVFQDFTFYAKYYYDNVDFEGNAYFTKINESDLAKINEHLDDFESWIETYKENDDSLEIVVNYDFDRAKIDKNDYIYIDSENLITTWDDGTTTTSFASYDIYFFDAQTQILYYFHNNI